MDDGKNDGRDISINDMEYLPVTKNVKESMRVQKTEYIRQQMRKRQEYEEAVMTQLLQEQRVIDSLQKKISENLEQTEASSRYNQEFKESMNAQIYAMHGISADKLEGMREYKKAYYQGSAFALFLLSVALVILCGVLHGFGSQICVFMLAYTGIEGALLAQGSRRLKILELLCRTLYLLLFPVMMAVFVCYELDFAEYEIILPYAAAAGLGVIVIAAISYFAYNPYRGIRRNVRDARGQIGDIERAARKEVRKNQKLRVKEEKKLHRQLQKEDRLQERLLRKDARRQSVKQAFANARDRLAGIFHAPGSYKNIDLEAELELEAAKAEPAEPAPGNAAGKDGQEGHA